MPRNPLGLRLRFALFFAALGLGGAALFGGGLWFGYARAGGPLDGYIIAGLIGALGLLGLAVWVGLLFDENVAKPILALASDLTTRAKSDVSSDIDAAPARYLGTLAPAAQAIHGALEAARADQARAVEEQTAAMARDKALLEALVRDLAEGVVVMSPAGNILLYNQVAVRILGDLGLDRPLDRFIRLEPIRESAARLAVSGDPGAQSFLAATPDGNRILTGAVSAVQSEALDIGHVLIFHDATEDLRTHAGLEALLTDLVDKARRPAMAIAAILDVFDTGEEVNPDMAARLTDAMRGELAGLTGDIERIAANRDHVTSSHWPIRAVSVHDVFDTLAARHPGTATASALEILIECDGFAVTTILDHVLAEVATDPARAGIRLDAKVQGDEVQLLIAWDGPALPQARLEALLEAPLSADYGAYTARDALVAHRTDMWIEAGPQVVLPLALTESGAATDLSDRIDFYDFGLMRNPGPDRPLSELTYVVFDTETTGLDPAADAVVQIAGVRILNGRLVAGERFDSVVDPGRPIPPSSTRIHGITDAMVAGAPDFRAAGASFAEFSDGAVLVAHNAPFDMAFLKRLEAEAPVVFNHPVLCTARLSLALKPHEADHTLDALAETFGVDLDEAIRHTALGDAQATAEVFLKMLPLLADRGVTGLNEALAFQAKA